MAKSIKSVARFAAPVIGGLALGPAGLGIASALGGAAIGSGVGTLATGGSVKDALLSGLGSYAGGSIGGKLIGGTIGSELGSGVSSALGSTIANTSIGEVIGSYAGNKLTNDLMNPVNLGSAGNSGKISSPQATPEPQPFEPTREPQLQLPNSLSGLSSLAPDQVSSNLATQGVYGGGLGPAEEDYFTNMINRRLVDDSGQVDQNLSEISPIESSFLAQLGLGGYNNPSSLLEAIYGRRKQVSA